MPVRRLRIYWRDEGRAAHCMTGDVHRPAHAARHLVRGKIYCWGRDSASDAQSPPHAAARDTE